MPGNNEYSISPVLTARTGTGTEATSTLVAKSAATPVTTSATATSTPTTDYRKSALQNSEHNNWRDAYSEYSGKNGSWRERRNFRKDWKNEANVRARVGEDTYNQLRSTAEQEQFGSLGYNPDGDNTLTREEKRFDRRFNRQLRNGKYDSYLTKPQSTSSAYNFSSPLLFNMTTPVFKTAYSFGSTPPTPDPPTPDPPTPDPPTPIDYNAEGLKLFGKDYKDYMNSDNLTKIQQFLVDNKYDLGNYGSNKNGVDGKYGQKTHDALTKYLEANPQGKGWANIHALFTPPPKLEPDEKPQQEQIIEEQIVAEQPVHEK